MSPEQQRIVIAKACGLTIVSDGITHHLTPCGKKTEREPDGCLLKECPDYLNDLNAMAAAESLIIKAGWQTIRLYEDELQKKVANIVFASAAQRAESFLRVLNLWIE